MVETLVEESICVTNTDGNVEEFESIIPDLWYIIWKYQVLDQTSLETFSSYLEAGDREMPNLLCKVKIDKRDITEANLSIIWEGIYFNTREFSDKGKMLQFDKPVILNKGDKVAISVKTKENLNVRSSYFQMLGKRVRHIARGEKAEIVERGRKKK